MLVIIKYFGSMIIDLTITQSYWCSRLFACAIKGIMAFHLLTIHDKGE